MTAIVHLIRHSPVNLLKEYFSCQPYYKEIDWTCGSHKIQWPLLKAIDKMNYDDREYLISDSERIQIMTDELGQVALASVATDLQALNKMGTSYHRALWTFLYDIINFRRAEEIRYAAGHFKCEMYDGFIGPKNIDIMLNLEQILLFEQKIKQFFNLSGSSKVEIFNRNYINNFDKKIKSFQVIIFLEESSEGYLGFEKKDVIVKVIHPVEELTITYEPETGQIDITFKNDEDKKDIVRIFVQTLLLSKNKSDMYLRRYNIAKLLKPYNFMTDPKDGIESVKVVFLELKPLDSNNRIIIQCSAQEKRSIYKISQDLFERGDLLETKFELIQVTIFIRFYPDKDNKQDKLLSVTISIPNKCNAKSKNTKERFILNKYFKLWGLIETV